MSMFNVVARSNTMSRFTSDMFRLQHRCRDSCAVSHLISQIAHCRCHSFVLVSWCSLLFDFRVSAEAVSYVIPGLPIKYGVRVATNARLSLFLLEPFL